MATLLTDLKSLVGQKKAQIEANLVSSKIHSVRNGATFLDNLEAIAQGSQKIDFYHEGPTEEPVSKALEETLRKEMQQFRKRHEQHQKAV